MEKRWRNLKFAATVAAGLAYTTVVGARFQPGRRRRARPGAEELVDLTVQLNKLWGGTAALSHVSAGTTLPRHRRAEIGDEPVEELVELAFVDSHDESPVLVHLEDRIGHAVALALEPGCNRYRYNSEDGDSPGEAAMRAMCPDTEGFIERGGVKVGYEVFGAGEPAIVLLPAWAIVHARQWKAQVPYLARRFRVITVEGRGNGRADRPASPAAYRDREYVDDVIAVLDATGTDQAVLIGLSLGARHALQLAAWHPERAAGVVAIGTAWPGPIPPDFDEPKDSYQDWGKANRHYWLADYRGWVEFFMSQVFTEPHSTKQHEDGVAWGLETTAETLVLTVPALGGATEAEAEAVCRQVRCPVLIVHGDQDGIVPYETGAALARWTGGQMVTIRGGGHAPILRDPVKANLLIRRFAESLGPSAPAS